MKNEKELTKEEKYEFEMDRDMFYNLKYGSMTDSVDEFIKSREFLSQGDLVFIYKNAKDRDVENNLLEVCIRLNNVYTTNDNILSGLDQYIVEIITEEYSVIYPHVPRTYLEVELYDLLKDSKVSNDVLITYKQIIEDLKV